MSSGCAADLTDRRTASRHGDVPTDGKEILGIGEFHPPPRPVDEHRSVRESVRAKKSARVAKVLDGATFELENGRRVRLLGVAAPEPGAGFYGDEAAALLRRLLHGRVVRLYVDRPLTLMAGSYDAFPAFVTREDGMDVVAEMLGTGSAQAEPSGQHPRAQELASIEARARAAGVGMWNDEARRAWEQRRSAGEEP